MSVILQINWIWDTDQATANRIDPDHARQYAELPGLHWKIWINDPETRTNGGIHLFDDRVAATAYADSIRERITAMPGVSNFSAIVFDIKEEASRITHAPVGTSSSESAEGRRRTGSAAAERSRPAARL